jgi:transposase
VWALGLDEVLFVREGPYRRQHFSTSIVDVGRGQLLDVVPGRRGAEPKAWLQHQGTKWLGAVRVATLDLAGSYRAVFDEVVPGATQVADPFHVVKFANEKLDECRRRVQDELLGHRGRKDDPLYKIRRVLLTGSERLNQRGVDRMALGLRLEDPDDEVLGAWLAN